MLCSEHKCKLTPSTQAPIWINFWLNTLSAGKFTIEEALALMGSHTLIDNQACTTDAGGDGTAITTIGGAGCSGTKRLFQWNNAYFLDTNSGTCQPRVRHRAQL